MNGGTHVHDTEIGSGSDVHRRFFPRLCNHCDNPPCMSVCPTGATYKMDNGIVMVDEDLCMGCRACAMACPYDARRAVTYDDVEKGKAFYGEAYRRERPSVDKCTFCEHRVKEGLQPACVETCVGSARMFGDLDNPGGSGHPDGRQRRSSTTDATPGHPAQRLLHRRYEEEGLRWTPP